ncbi:MAG: glycosyltransferase [Bryobacterales bacterium]|nr:glycosyltransferase [Bryobacterales bacterium]
MPEAVDYSVIVTTRDRPAQLHALLGFLAALDFPRHRFEVIVVDDGSASPLHLQPPPGLNLRLFTCPHAGPAYGRNLGAQHAAGRYLAFIDDDCEPTPAWLTAFHHAHTTAPNALLGGRTLNGLPANPYSEASQFIVEIVYAFYNPDPTHARFFATNNMALPRATFLALGGFDERYRFASEDRDLCARWLEGGHPMRYVPGALIRHCHPLDCASFCRQHFSYGQGANRFHRTTGERGTGRLRDHFGFHLQLPRWFAIAWQRHPGLPALRLWSLLLLWQLANLAGYLTARFGRG